MIRNVVKYCNIVWNVHPKSNFYSEILILNLFTELSRLTFLIKVINNNLFFFLQRKPEKPEAAC